MLTCENSICIMICLRTFRPSQSEVFSLSEVYGHIHSWNEDFEFRFGHDDGDGYQSGYGKGIQLEMQEWAPEAARRVVSCSAFVLVPFKEMYEMDGEVNDCQLLYNR